MYEESELSYFKGGLAVGMGLGLLSRGSFNDLVSSQKSIVSRPST